MKPLAKRLLIGAGLVFVVAPVARYLLVPSTPEPTPVAAESANVEQYAHVGSDTQVLVSTQDAEGVTEDQIDSAGAERLGAHSLERVRIHTAKILAEMNSTESADSITADTVLLSAEGRKVIVTRFHLGSKVPFIQFAGINGKELVRVLCMAKPTQDVFLAGKCGEQLKSTFGVSLDYLNGSANG